MTERRAKVTKSRVHLGYVRVSSTLQRDSGISIESQEKQIRQFAALRGVEIEEIVHDDGRSGSSVKKRPGMQRVLAAVERGEIASLTVFKLDRGFRNMQDLSNAVALMQKHGCEFVSVSERIDTSSAMGKAMLNLLGVFAQFERDVAGERTKDGLDHIRSQGRVYSHVVPYGYRSEAGRLQTDDAAQGVLARIIEATNAGTGPTAIARQLNLEQVAAPGGSKWYASSVASVLKTSGNAA